MRSRRNGLTPPSLSMSTHGYRADLRGSATGRQGRPGCARLHLDQEVHIDLRARLATRDRVENANVTRAVLGRIPQDLLPAGGANEDRVERIRSPLNGNDPVADRSQSGRLDSNQRPLAPKASALPGCATPRTPNQSTAIRFVVWAIANICSQTLRTGVCSLVSTAPLPTKTPISARPLAETGMRATRVSPGFGRVPPRDG